MEKMLTVECSYCYQVIEYPETAENTQVFCLRCLKATKIPKGNVNHPSYYGGDTMYETIKVIEAWGYQNNHYRATAIEYLSRAGKKINEIEDLKKAMWWIQREINKLEQTKKVKGKVFNECSHCAMPVKDNDIMCSSCGRKFKEDANAMVDSKPDGEF